MPRKLQTACDTLVITISPLPITLFCYFSRPNSQQTQTHNCCYCVCVCVCALSVIFSDDDDDDDENLWNLAFLCVVCIS